MSSDEGTLMASRHASKRRRREPDVLALLQQAAPVKVQDLVDAAELHGNGDVCVPLDSLAVALLQAANQDDCSPRDLGARLLTAFPDMPLSGPRGHPVLHVKRDYLEASIVGVITTEGMPALVNSPGRRRPIPPTTTMVDPPEQSISRRPRRRMGHGRRDADGVGRNGDAAGPRTHAARPERASQHQQRMRQPPLVLPPASTMSASVSQKSAAEPAREHRTFKARAPRHAAAHQALPGEPAAAGSGPSPFSSPEVNPADRNASQCQPCPLPPQLNCTAADPLGPGRDSPSSCFSEHSSMPAPQPLQPPQPPPRVATPPVAAPATGLHSGPMLLSPLPDAHVLGVRLLFDTEGRLEPARAMWAALCDAPYIIDCDDLRDVTVACKVCKRALSVLAFQAPGGDGSTVHCLACHGPHDQLRRCVPDPDVFEPYLRDDRALGLPKLSCELKPGATPAGPDFDAIPRQWRPGQFRAVLEGLGSSHLRHAAGNVGVQASPTASLGHVAHQITAAVLNRSAYVNTNVPIDTLCTGASTRCAVRAAVTAARAGETTWQKRHGMTSSKTSTTLFLAGLSGTFTDWHIDWAEAVNVAIAELVPDGADRARPPGGSPAEPVAIWWFLSPAAIPIAAEFLAQHRPPGCAKEDFATTADAPMTDNELASMQAYVMARGELMIAVPQRVGDRVYVPPGWMHTVINKRPCVKVAWDVYEDGHWGHYLLASHSLLARWTQERNSSDYMDVESALVAQLRAAQEAGYRRDSDLLRTVQETLRTSLVKRRPIAGEAGATNEAMQPDSAALTAPDRRGSGCDGAAGGQGPVAELDEEWEWLGSMGQPARTLEQPNDVLPPIAPLRLTPVVSSALPTLGKRGLEDSAEPLPHTGPARPRAAAAVNSPATDPRLPHDDVVQAGRLAPTYGVLQNAVCGKAQLGSSTGAPLASSEPQRGACAAMEYEMMYGNMWNKLHTGLLDSQGVAHSRVVMSGATRALDVTGPGWQRTDHARTLPCPSWDPRPNYRAAGS